MGKYAKGIDFENEAFEDLANVLHANYIYDYYLIQDVAYKGVSRFEQVDCMLICSYGIYCFEMKNWHGDVKPCNDDRWVIYNHGKKTNREFTNPIKQNERHCAFLKFMLDKQFPAFKSSRIPVYSIVLFSDRTGIMNSSKRNVMHIDDVPKYIKKHNMNLDETICDGAFQIIKKIKEQCLPEYERLHAHQIRTLG